MKSMKRMGAGLMMLALLLTLFTVPAVADDTYTVTLPDGATGPATVAEGEDYTFSLSEDVLIVAYAEFTDGSICAAEVAPVFENGTDGAVTGYTRTIPGTLINSDFVIKTFTVETTGNGSFFNKGNGSEEVPYEIDSELALLQLMAASTTSFSGSGDTLTVYDDADKYYVLTEDISLHTPISICLAPHSAGVSGRTQFCQSFLGTTITTATPFSATIDGNNHTLALLNIWVENVDSIMALIPRHSGTVKNLNVTTPNDYLFSDSEIAVNMISVLVGENLSGGMIQNCSVTSNILLDNITFYSGSVSSSYFSLIASKNSGVIDSCKANGSIQIKSEHSKGVYAGMISGYNFGGTISNCIAEGTVYQSDKSGNNYIGGITGFNQQINNTCKAVISSCINHADVTGTTGTTSGSAYIGGIAGATQGHAAYPSEIVNCLNDGEVSSLESGGKNEYVGGIAGRALAAGSVVGCYNLGSVSSHGTSSNNFAGGVIGQNNGSAVTVQACYSYVNNLPAIWSFGNTWQNSSYVYSRSDNPDPEADPTTEEVELSAADFADPALVTTLNTALDATDDPIFVAGTDYPIFAWLASGSGSGTDDTYSVTLPDGATGPATVAAGEDYTFTLAENDLIVAYAEFADGSICAAKAMPTFAEGEGNTIQMNGCTRTIPGDCITGDFAIKTFTIETNGTGAFFDGGDGTAEHPFQIANELQLLKFMASCTSNTAEHMQPTVYVGEDMHYILTSDISFHTPISMMLAPIETAPSYYNYFDFAISAFAYSFFSATFDGDGHTISGLRYGDSFSTRFAIALIPFNAGVVKNLTLVVASAVIQSAYVTSEITGERYPYFFSPLVAINGGTIQDCVAAANNVTSHMNGNNVVGTTGDSREICIGLIAAFNSAGGSISGCQANGSVTIPESNTRKSLFAGMICGKNFGGTISRCISDGALNTTAAQNTNYIGGIAGQNVKSSAQDNFGNSTTSNVEAMITACENHANITGSASATATAYVGGITGVTQNSHITKCVNDGTVTTQDPGVKTENVGGIAGRGNGGGTVTGCYNLGSVSTHGTTTAYAGGIIGQNNNSAVTVTACFTYVNGQNAIGNVMTKNLSYTFILADETDPDADETSEEKELSAADFADPALVTTLNTALDATDDPIFVAGTDYPIFAWLAESAPAADLTAAVTNSTGTTPAATVNSAVAENGTAKLNVSGSKPCVVIACDGTSYTRMTAALSDDGISYDFTAPYAEGMTFTVAVKGDANGDGAIDANDLSLFVSASNGDFANSVYETGLMRALADADGSGTIDANDLSLLVDYANNVGLDW